VVRVAVKFIFDELVHGRLNGPDCSAGRPCAQQHNRNGADGENGQYDFGL
jgi:hypothetical protein